MPRPTSGAASSDYTLYMIVLDSHCDSPSQMYRLRDFGKDNSWGQVDFPKMKKGGIDASFFALFTSNSMEPKAAHDYALAMLAEVERQVAANSSVVAFARSAADIRTNKDKGLMSILIGMENGSPIMGSLDELRAFWDRGVRYMTLTHNGDNDICDSCGGQHKWGGLSPFGREVVAEMNRLGMIIDIAHCSDDTVRDCLSVSKAPIVTTHSCCKALAGHRRNLSDELMRGLADKGGVMQINFYPVFLSNSFAETLEASHLEDKMWVEDEFIADPSNADKVAAWVELQNQLNSLPRPSCVEIADHVDHAVKVCGVEHVGLGSDYDGIEVTPAGMEDISKYGLVFDELHRRGYSDDAIEKIAGGNFLRVMDEIQNLK